VALRHSFDDGSHNAKSAAKVDRVALRHSFDDGSHNTRSEIRDLNLNWSPSNESNVVEDTPIYPVPCDSFHAYKVPRFLRETWAWSLKDLSSSLFYRDVFSEFLLCLIILFYVGLVVITNNPGFYSPNTTTFGVFVCFIVYAMLEGWGPFGGAHLNPSATFSFMLCGRVSIAKGIFFIAAQSAGAAAGGAIAYGLTPSARKVNGNPFHAFNPAENGLTMIQACGVEGIIAFNLIFIAMSVRDPARNPQCSMPAMVIAFIKGVALLAAGTYTVGLSNPMVAFGIACVSEDFTNHWIYWVGPFIGGPAGAYLYKIFVFMNRRLAPKPKIVSASEICAMESSQASPLTVPLPPSKGDIPLSYTVTHDELMMIVQGIMRRNASHASITQTAVL
jgi:glycerol uptake facilitator-like aquaporin